MCGICGIVDFDGRPARDVVARMSDSLRHRGPDDSGLETIGAATLGFRRLSIIDLAGSHQPMSNEDESLWLLFNGEIYNYRSLREELIARGHRFKTSGDGEVILHLYEEEGDEFVHRLNGMFGIALWDAGRRRLVLVRDRLGIKPVYYHVSGRRLAFASETKALLNVPGLATDVDGEAVVGFMNYGSIPGRRTCLEAVRRLLPGHLAIWDETGFEERRYWDVSFAEKRPWEFGELVEATGELLRDAVSLRTVSDVPLGAFLSGGIDSSLVASLLAELSSKPVESFSIGYGKEGAFMDETPFAAAVAARHGMNHHELILDSEDLLRDLERVAWFLDEPCGDPAAFLTLALSEFTRRHVTVALSGVGADELFCGYRRYLGLRWQERWLGLPAWLREGILRRVVNVLPEARTNRLGDYARLARKFVGSVDRDVRTSWALTTSYLPDHPGPLFTGDFASAARGSYQAEAFDDYWSRTEGCTDAIDRVMYMDLRMYLPDQLLLLQDKMSMAASLEARVPFLDHRLVELAASAPVDLKLRGGTAKAVLKSLAERYMPRHCIQRPKKGFAAPVEAWLKGPLRDHVHEALSPRRVRERGIFAPDFVEWMKREFYAGGRDLSLQLYKALLLETWLQLYVDGRGQRYVGTLSPALEAGR